MLHVNILPVSAWTSWKPHLCIQDCPNSGKLETTLVYSRLPKLWQAGNNTCVFKTVPTLASWKQHLCIQDCPNSGKLETTLVYSRLSQLWQAGNNTCVFKTAPTLASWKQHLCIQDCPNSGKLETTLVYLRLPQLWQAGNSTCVFKTAPTLVDRWPAMNHGQMINDSIRVFMTAPLPHTEGNLEPCCYVQKVYVKYNWLVWNLVTYRQLRVTVVSLEPCFYVREADGDW